MHDGKIACMFFKNPELSANIATVLNSGHAIHVSKFAEYTRGTTAHIVYRLAQLVPNAYQYPQNFDSRSRYCQKRSALHYTEILEFHSKIHYINP